jgi:uncharacterized cofD-like protein
VSSRIEKKIAVIGGGSGPPVLDKALIIAGYKSITNISAVTDFGGITQRRRIDSGGQEIALSDGFRTLLALIDPETLVDPKVRAALEPLYIRTQRTHLGYEIFSHMAPNLATQGFDEMQKWLERVTGKPLLGTVIPVTTQSAQIVFETKLGRIYRGENELDDKRTARDPVQKMHLEPDVESFSKASLAILEADAIYSCFGSLHGSVLVNFLVKNISESYQQSKGTRVHITNLVSSMNETHNFKPEDFVKTFKRYTGTKHPLDVLIVPNISRRQFENQFQKVARHYWAEHSYFLGWTEEQLNEARKKLGITILTHDAMTIVEAAPNHLVVRHNPLKLAETLRKVT